MLLREAASVVGSPIAVTISQMLADGQDPLVSGPDLWLWLMPLFLFGETILYWLMADGKSGTEKPLHLLLQFYGATRQRSCSCSNFTVRHVGHRHCWWCVHACLSLPASEGPSHQRQRSVGAGHAGGRLEIRRLATDGRTADAGRGGCRLQRPPH